jgi:heptosyltransferase II
MKILIRGTNWIGDAVMSVPAMREVRRLFPDAHISLHTRSSTEGIFQNASFLDDIIAYRRNSQAWRDVYENYQYLADDDFDLAILLPNSFESAFTAFLSRIPRRIGYNKDLRGLLLTDPVPVPEWKSRRHEVFYYLNLIREAEHRLLGSDTVGRAAPDMTIEISEPRSAAAKALLNAAGVDAAKPKVAFGVGSTNSRAKRWPAERYAKLADDLVRQLGADIVLLGAPDEAEIASRVVQLSNSALVDLVGKTDIGSAAAVLSEMDLLISNDMGLAHLAPTVGTRSITIFGPTDHETTRPYSEAAEIIRHQVECSPCMLRDCPIDHRCMTRISVETVAQRALLALSEPNANEFIETTGSIS